MQNMLTCENETLSNAAVNTSSHKKTSLVTLFIHIVTNHPFMQIFIKQCIKKVYH